MDVTGRACPHLYSLRNIELLLPPRVIAIVQHIIRSFVLHISLVCPLGESGKLQMASDMTGLEFALSSFLAESQNKPGGSLESIGKEYRALRAMRCVPPYL